MTGKLLTAESKALDSNANQDFLMIEYQESAKSYSNGVDIGFSMTKYFLAANGVLITMQQAPLELVSSSETAQYLQNIAPLFGVLAGLILACFINLYFNHLGNCLTRCCQIEQNFGGRLFRGNSEVGESKINTKLVLWFFAIVSLAFWTGQLVYVYKSSF